MAPVAPYGSWPSPISAADVAGGGVVPGFVQVTADGTVCWSELLPAQGGRTTVRRRRADGTVEELLPAPWNARTRVHEYGGRAFLLIGDGLVFSSWTDQRLYRVEPGGEPTPLTPEPSQPHGWRYAEPVAGADGELWCVRESHGDRVSHEIVAVPLDGAAADAPDRVRVITAGSDFVAAPRLSPDGRRLAWLAWDHPRMPWDGSELRVAELAADGTCGPARTLLGGPTESVFQPEWADPDTLYAVSDRSGWWNLYRVAVADPDPHPLAPRAEEFGVPLWLLGYASYAPLGDGRIAVLHGTDALRLGLLDPSSGALEELDIEGLDGYTSWHPTLSAAGGRLAGVAAGPQRAAAVLAVDPAARRAEVLCRSRDQLPDPAYLPEPQPWTVTGPDGREVHAIVYPPRNPAYRGPADERPPYVVFVHGGPTAQVVAELDLAKAFFTSRGLGVVDVNYGGSTGYGRTYRERLRRQWGIVDVADCVTVARDLADRGLADGKRLAIRGGSAGGWTTLAALTRTDAFGAGTSYFGVAELLRFAEDTHDFESRYLDSLIGELPADRDVYVERAPLSHVDELSCPVLLLQGLEDEVVPPSQSELFRDALARKGIPHAYLAFEGEQHGFRKAETVITCLEAELSFYGQVFGFDPPEIPRLELS